MGQTPNQHFPTDAEEHYNYNEIARICICMSLNRRAKYPFHFSFSSVRSLIQSDNKKVSFSHAVNI